MSVSTKIIEVTGTQPLVTVDDNVSNVEVVNQPINVTVQSAVAVGNTTIRNALDAIDPIDYDKITGVISFIDRSEVVRAEKMIEPATLPNYAGDISGDVELDAENYDIFVLNIAGDITSIEFANIADGQTVTIIGTQSATGQGNIDDTSGNWANWYWINDNADLPQNVGDVFMIKVLWTGNTYYASLMEFNTLMPTTQVGIPVGDQPPSDPDSGWLWYRYNDPDNSDALMIYVDGDWVVAGGGGGGASVIIGPDEPTTPPPSDGDLWYDTNDTNAVLKIYNNNAWEIVNESPPGFTGSAGFTGSRGMMGFTGSAGFTGSQGYDGSTGFTGSQGYAGSTGYDGSRGQRGWGIRVLGELSDYTQLVNYPQNFPMDQGNAYKMLDTGHLWVYTGYAEDNTPPAPQGWADYGQWVGYTGSQGTIGYTGSASTAPGYTGSQGFTGSAGLDSTVPGPVGSRGFVGSKGDIGYTGSQGDKGFTGSQGAQGDTGFNGSKGDIGYTGSQGEEGPQGDPLKIVDNVPTVGDLPDPYTGTFNDVYIVDENGHAYMNQGLDPAVWNDIGQWVGYTGSLGYTGSRGFTGSAGFTGSTGLTGSQGPTGADGTGVIDEDAPADGEQYARVRQPLSAEGTWELVEATGGGGDWDGVLFDKSAVIDQDTAQGVDLTDTYSGITIGKNGYLNSTLTPLPQLNNSQKDNLVIGRNSYINGSPLQNITVLGSGLGIEVDLLPYGNENALIMGNFGTLHYHMGATLGISDTSINRYGEDLPVVKIEPLGDYKPSPDPRNLVLTSRSGSLILANDYDPTEKDQMLQINSTRIRHRGSILPDGNPQSNVKRSEIYFDSTNFYSAGEAVTNPATETNELADVTLTWISRRNINYFSPERVRFRKFAECVNYQAPGDDSRPSDYPDQTYAGPNLDIDINRGTIHHRILTDNVNSIDITDVEWADPDIGRANFQHIDHPLEPGTSMTIILYHQTALRTITWPSNFKFLGGENTLSTEASTLPAQTINGVTISNIQAIDILHAFYDGNTWWSSITRGYE